MNDSGDRDAFLEIECVEHQSGWVGVEKSNSRTEVRDLRELLEIPLSVSFSHDLHSSN